MMIVVVLVAVLGYFGCVAIALHGLCRLADTSLFTWDDEHDECSCGCQVTD